MPSGSASVQSGSNAGPLIAYRPAPYALRKYHRDARNLRLRKRGDHLGPVPDDSLALDRGADHEPGHIRKEEQWDIERVAARDETRCLVGGVHEEHAAFEARLRCEDADGVTVDARETADDLACE